MREIETLLRELKRYGNAGRDCALAAEDALAIAAALEAAREDACVNSAMVERALSHKAFCEDGASWPDAYSEDEQRIERDAMAALIAAALRSGGPAAYCRACQWAGMSNCAHFDECSGATCITCHRPLNQAIDQARGKGGGEVEGG